MVTVKSEPWISINPLGGIKSVNVMPQQDVLEWKDILWKESWDCRDFIANPEQAAVPLKRRLQNTRSGKCGV